MAITYPYPVSFLADRLNIETVTWDIKRNDELSGSGDSRIWQAELAAPLWTGDVTLNVGYHDDLKQIAALIRKLHGAQEQFYLYDPLSKFPQADPDGSILGFASVRIDSIGIGGRTVSLGGLPANYVLTLADKVQIYAAANPARTRFIELSENASANGAGVTGQIEVFPHIGPGFAANDPVRLKQPACKVFIMPTSHNPGSASGLMTTGAAFKVMEKR